MKKTCLLLILLPLFFACENNDDITDTCISNCSTSTPGRINLAIENHTSLDIKNLVLIINGSATSFKLLPKSIQGSYSCWQTFDNIELISSIEFDIGENASFQEMVNYRNLSREREFAIDIQSLADEELRIQLVEAPSCVSDAN